MALSHAEFLGEQQAFFLEKDVWVVEILNIFFNAPFGKNLIFKGGTSLSKSWNAVLRFSDEIDITYDIRAFASDLVSGAGKEALPPTRSQEKRWTKTIRNRLRVWTRAEALPAVREALSAAELPAQVEARADRIILRYDLLFARTEYFKPEVIVEFGSNFQSGQNIPNRGADADDLWYH